MGGCRRAGPTGGGRPRSTGDHGFEGIGDKARGIVSVGAPKWGLIEMEPSGTATSGD